MNWALLAKALPTAIKIVRAMIEGLRDGASNEEIRKRIADPGLILDHELDDLRAAQDDLDDYIRTGR